MTSDGYAIVTTLFSEVWRFFTSWNIPGTNTTPAAWFMFIMVAGISIKVGKRLLSRNLGGSGGSKEE